MSTFEKAIGVILKHEGGYVNNPNDNGMATNFGVSLRFLQSQPIQVGDFDHDGDVDAEDIKNMTVQDATSIYRTFWWDKFRYSLIEDQTIATKVFDLSVNMGAVRAHKLLQTALNNQFALRLTVDGVIGNATLNCINNAFSSNSNEQLLLTAYCNEAWGFYQRLIAGNSKFQVFERGWKIRAFALIQANSI